MGARARLFVWRGGAAPPPYRRGELLAWASARIAAVTGWAVRAASVALLPDGSRGAALAGHHGGEALAIVLAGAERRVRWTGGGEIALGHGDVLVLAEDWRALKPTVVPTAGLTTPACVVEAFIEAQAGTGASQHLPSLGGASLISS